MPAAGSPRRPSARYRHDHPTKCSAFRGGPGMRIAVVGGTGSFGRALAIRLREAGHDVVVGSRDEERAAQAAAEVDVEGARNDEAARGADLVVLAVKADGMLSTAEELAAAIGTTPVLCVGAELRFGPDGVRPTLEATSLAERVAERLSAS